MPALLQFEGLACSASPSCFFRLRLSVPIVGNRGSAQAIAVAPSVIGTDEEETSAGLGIVFLLSTALLLSPSVGHHFGLTQHGFGLWTALAINDTPSVVGASATYGPEALMVATTTKRVRPQWVVPVTFGLGPWPRDRTLSRQKAHG